MNRTTSALTQYLAVTYALLAIYGSLHPFNGWTLTETPPFAFLFAGWPTYYTRFDLAANTIAYVPLGLLWMLLLLRRLRPGLALMLTLLFASMLSLGNESLQNYLPSRIPSNLDWACNSLGALLGALAAWLFSLRPRAAAKLQDYRERLFCAGEYADAGIVLLLLCLLAQINPTTRLLGFGYLPGLLSQPPSPPAFWLELLMAATQLLVVALIVARLCVSHRQLQLLLWLALAVLLKSGALIVATGGNGLAWLTPATLTGLLVGYGIWRLAGPTMLAARFPFALAALLLAVISINLLPEQPYVGKLQQLGRTMHFPNFYGLTRLLASIWPLLLLPWLFRRRSEDGDNQRS